MTTHQDTSTERAMKLVRDLRSEAAHPHCKNPNSLTDAADEIERLSAALASLDEAAQHSSDCAVHNEPAYPAGPCDCGVQPQGQSLTRDQIESIMTRHYPLDSLLRENVDAFEECVHDIERTLKVKHSQGQQATSDEIIELAGALEIRRILEAIKTIAKIHPADDIPTPYQAAWQSCCEEIFFQATGEQWHMDEDDARFHRASNASILSNAELPQGQAVSDDIRNKFGKWAL